jgi:hypothetical protein
MTPICQLETPKELSGVKSEPVWVCVHGAVARKSALASLFREDLACRSSARRAPFRGRSKLSTSTDSVLWGGVPSLIVAVSRCSELMGVIGKVDISSNSLRKNETLAGSKTSKIELTDRMRKYKSFDGSKPAQSEHPSN